MGIRSPNWFGGIESRPFGARGHCSAAGSARVKGGYSLSRKRITPFKSPKRKVLTLQASSLKSCGACRIGCLPGGVAIRLGLLLSSLSLCLRFVSLTQSPSTRDLCKFASACRGDFAALAAIYALSVVGDYTEPAIRFESGSG